MNLRHIGVVIGSVALLLSPFIHDVANGDESESSKSDERLIRKVVSEQPVRANTQIPPADSDKVQREQQAPQPQAVKPPSSSLRKGLASKTPVAEPEEECGEITVPIPDMKVLPLNNHLFGDTEIGDSEGAQLKIRAYLKQTPMRVGLTVEVQISEDRHGTTVFTTGEDTHFQGVYSAIFYDARQENYGCKIASVLNSKIKYPLAVYGGPAYYTDMSWFEIRGRDQVFETQYGWVSVESDKRGLQTFLHGNEDLIAESSCILNTNGDDKGELGCTNIKFNPLRLKLIKNDPQRCDSFHLVDHPPLWLKPLKHYKGDSDIKGNERDISLADSRGGTKSPYLRVLNGERVQLVGNLGIRERTSDFSSFESNFALDVASLWDVPPQCRIVSAQIDDEHIDQSTFTNAIKDQNYHGYDSEGLFWKLICRTDTGTHDGMTSDEGGVGCRVYPRTIKINLAHAGAED